MAADFQRVMRHVIGSPERFRGEGPPISGGRELVMGTQSLHLWGPSASARFGMTANGHANSSATHIILGAGGFRV